MNQHTAIIGGKELLSFIFLFMRCQVNNPLELGISHICYLVVLFLKVNVVARRFYASSLASI